MENPSAWLMNDGHQAQHLDHEELADIIRVLRERGNTRPIIVEGVKDTESLRALGVRGHILHINIGKALIDFCTDISHEFREVIILTDWDSKGNTLCRRLKQNFKACDVSFDTRLRGRLAAILRKEIKDIESIHSFLARNHPDFLELVLNEVPLDDLGDNNEEHNEDDNEVPSDSNKDNSEDDNKDSNEEHNEGNNEDNPEDAPEDASSNGVDSAAEENT